MTTLCWAAKGGSGTTVVVAGLALVATEPTLVVDLAGDVPAVLGLGHTCVAGVGDWLASDVPTERLRSLEIEVRAGLDLLPLGTPAPSDTSRHDELGDWLSGQHRQVIVDAGTGEPPVGIMRHATASWLVTRPCFLALTAAARQAAEPDGIIVVDEVGRALRTSSIESAVGAPVVLELLHDPAVSRAVDAGLLAARLPRGFRRRLATTRREAA